MRKTALLEQTSKNVLAHQGALLADGKSLPPPVGGWDAISPIANMPPDRAIKLENWFPQTLYVELRNGYVEHSDCGTDEPVESLMAYQGTGDDKLFGASDDTIFDCTVAQNATPVVTGLNNARFQHTNFSTTGGHFLYCVNGADAPQYYDGSAWAVAVITGFDETDTAYINAFKNRLFFIFNNSTEFGYLPVDSIQGTGKTFELGGFMTMGGYIVAMSTWSIDAGDGPDDYAVFVTSRGQVIIYKGSDPDNAPEDWLLVGVFNMGAPIGRRCLLKVGADVVIISIDGVLPLSKAMIFERAAALKIALTQNIQPVMNASARAYGSNFGWQGISYPRGTRFILNVPIDENVEQEQYVMNTITGAWCKFTNHNGSCWELLNDTPYFGGNNGVVYQADESGADDGEGIMADMVCAFNRYGSTFNKRWTACQPLLTTDNQVAPGLAFNVDFQEDAPISVAASVPSNKALWDVAQWDVDLWPVDRQVQTDWLSVAGVGHYASIRMVVDIDQPGTGLGAVWGTSLWGTHTWEEPAPAEIVLQVNGFNVTFEPGRAFV